MKKWVVLIIACLFTNILSQTNILPQFSELKENEDQQGKSNVVTSEIVNLYPLAIGNKWIYDGYHFNNGNTYQNLYMMEVNGIYLQPNGKLYYIWRTYTTGYPGANIFYERIDSSTSKTYKYDESLGLPDDEYLIDDLLAEPGDTVLSYRFYLPGSSFTIVIRDTLFEKWGLTKTKRVFKEIGPGIPKPTYSLTQDIGLDSMFFDWDYNTTDTYVLKGCVINGIVYGDTTTVGVEDEENPIAKEFRLEQNYPNPFNPTTTISFIISQSQDVELKLFDVLGNEIAVLIDEYQQAGEHKIEFNGSILTSGIYFYQLKVADFQQTKKLLLLK